VNDIDSDTTYPFGYGITVSAPSQQCFPQDTFARCWLNLQSAFDLKQAEDQAGRKIAAEIRPMAQGRADLTAA